MNKLLSAEFVRLFQSFVFKLGVLFSAGFGAFVVLMRWWDVKCHSEEYAKFGVEYSNADGLIFVGGMYLIFVAAVFIGIFVGTEYSDGTIRNKLAAGHVRRDIYLSKFIVCGVADSIMYLVYILAVLVFGNLLIGGTTMHAAQLFSYTAVSITAMLALTAFLLLFSMSIQNKAAGSVVCLLATLIMMFAALTIKQRLDAPEYYDAYSCVDQNTGETIEVEKEKNPQYLTGTKRKVYEFFNNVLPVSQLYQIVMNISENLTLIVFSDCVIMIATTAAGIVIFGRRNIR